MKPLVHLAQRGFSLLEVLISLVVTAVGVLGMMALQGKSITYTQDTLYQDTIVSATDELVEIMRIYRDELFSSIPPSGLNAANIRGTYGEFYANLKSSSDLYNSSGEFQPTAEDDCPTSGTPQTLKAAAGCWLKKYKATLQDFKVARLCPSYKPGTGSDSCDSSFSGSSIVLAMQWTARDKICSGSTTCTYTVRLEL